MAVPTAVQPKRAEETFSIEDLAEIKRIIKTTHDTYVRQVSEADFALNQAKRTVNRATHEKHRLQTHLSKIEDFCRKHNIDLNDEEKE